MGFTLNSFPSITTEASSGTTLIALRDLHTQLYLLKKFGDIPLATMTISDGVCVCFTWRALRGKVKEGTEITLEERGEDLLEGVGRRNLIL